MLHVGQDCETLLPAEPGARARAITWMFAALNSVEPHVQNLAAIDLFFADQDWAQQRRPGAQQMVEKRLDEVAARLDRHEYLEADGFTAGDLLMTSVLRILRHTDLVAKRPALEAYRLRCEARPAFERALEAQLAPFKENAPPAEMLPAASAYRPAR